EDSHGLFLAEPRVQELDPDLAQLLLVRRAERLAELARRRRDLRLKLILPLGLELVALGHGIRVEQTVQAILGRAGPPRDEAKRGPGAQRHDQENAGGHQSLDVERHWPHTLIATIFLITQAPTTWPAAAMLKALTPTGVLNNVLI